MRCPCCEQELPDLESDVERMMRILRARADRELYECHDGSFALTFEGGEVSLKTVQSALNQGLLKLRYPTQPEVKCYVPRERVIL